MAPTSTSLKFVILSAALITAVFLKLTGFTVPEVKPAKTPMARKMLTGSELEKLNFRECPEVSHAIPATLMPYTNANLGIVFDVPYNPLWGAAEFQVPPWQMTGNNDLYFGPVEAVLSDNRTCRLYRRYSFSSLPIRPLGSIFADNDAQKLSEHSILEINGHQTAIYRLTGQQSTCLDQYFEIAGGRANYVFTAKCGQNTEEQDKIELEQIVKSFHAES